MKIKTKILFLVLLSSLSFSQWPFKKDLEWYKSGPEKGWSKRDHEKYNNWRDDIFLKRFTDEDDPQLLRIQKAILNGNKITTEIWNYCSISSRGNRFTDIIWE